MLKSPYILPLICTLLLLSSLDLIVFGENHYVYLAHAFLHGSLYYLKIPEATIDAALYNNHYFWVNGPFPSILLSPFVFIFGMNMQESFLKLPLNLLNFFLVFKIAKSLRLPDDKALTTAVFYILGSTYTPVATIPFSVYLSAIVTNSALLFALYEFLNKRRIILISLCLSAAIATRFPPLFAIPFFLYPLAKKPALSKIIAFFAPLFATFLLISIYNFARFGNPLETGHRYQITTTEQSTRKEVGIFSVRHLPANLFYMLLNSPRPVLTNDVHVFKRPYLVPDYFGMSLFILSPVLFLLVKTNLKEKYVKESYLTILIMLLPITLYYGIGYLQIGYWHALDFFPFLLIPLCSAFQKTRIKSLLILTIIGVLITWFFTIETLVAGKFT